MTQIMLVDDDRELLEIYNKIFKMNGFDVISCENAEKALSELGKHQISVVVSDIIMPKMSGIELLREIKKRTPQTEVIMLTAEGSISGAVEAVKEGAFSYLVKPADVEELISNIKKAAELSKVKKENEVFTDCGRVEAASTDCRKDGLRSVDYRGNRHRKRSTCEYDTPLQQPCGQTVYLC